MNAYELADELIYSGDRYMMNVGLMLRQQADRIAELEELNETFVDLIKSYRVEIETLRQEILNKENEK